MSISRLCKGHPFKAAGLSALLMTFTQATVLPGTGALLPVQWLGHMAWGALVLWFLAIADLPWKKALTVSLFASFIYFFMTLYWLTIAMAVYGELSWALSIFSLAMLAALFSCFMAPAPVLGFYLHRKFSWPLLVTLPTTWVAHDYARTHSLTGYPWANIADSQSLCHLRLIQIADITGEKGVTWLLIAGNVLIALALLKRLSWKHAVVFGMLVATALGYGEFRLRENAALFKKGNSDTLRVSALQGNVPQDEKWDRAYVQNILLTYAQLVKSSGEQKAEIAVWPEAAFPLLTERNLEQFPSMFVGSLYQLIGLPTQDEHSLLNTALLIDPSLRVVGAYDKNHLVPFGEYVPLKNFFFFVERLVPAIGDFRPGPEPAPLILKKGGGLEWKLGIILCYEDIFPYVARTVSRKGADVLLNMTNDAWYGRSSAAYQHLSIAIYRAVENRRSLIRSTNTGITVWVLPDGRLGGLLPWFTQDILLADIPKPQTGMSLYTRWGDWFPIACLFISLSGFLGCMVTMLVARMRKPIWPANIPTSSIESPPSKPA